jgi:hypothetical protein
LRCSLIDSGAAPDMLTTTDAQTRQRKKAASLARRALAEKNLKRQIARSFLRGATPEMEALLRACIVDKPVQIKSVSFQKSAIRLEIDWPFLLPEATGNPDDWLQSNRDLRNFQKEFRLLLLEQRQAAKLGNLLHGEFVAFLERFFGAAKYEPYPIGRDSDVTVRDYLELTKKVAKEGRSAGPRRTVIPPSRAAEMRREGCRIILVLDDMRKDNRRPLGEITSRTESLLLAKLVSDYDSDRYPWMKYFRRSWRRLGTSKGWKHPNGPLLAAPPSWSAKELAVWIIHYKYLQKSGADYPVGAISKVVKCGAHSHR